MRGTNQGGSLAGFIIVGVLLTLVLIGGLYGLNRYNAEKAADEAIAEEQVGTEDTTNTATERERTAEQQKKQTTSPTTDGTKTTDPGDATPTPRDQSSTGQLPQTGPADALYGIFVVSLVAFVATHYVRSRQLSA